MMLPAGVVTLTLGNFNHPIDCVSWPEKLEVLTFGSSFNQSLEGVVWPSGLRTLNLGLSFDQPLEGGGVVGSV